MTQIRVRYHELDGYRGLAALAVVVFHAHIYGRSVGTGPRGILGVQGHPFLNALDGAVAAFFALSGFVIALPIARALLAGGPRPPVGRFLGRRAARLLPLYYLALGTFGVAVWQGWGDLLAHLTFLHIFSPTYALSMIGPAWSLACEAIYYALVALVTGPLALACARLGTARARAALIMALLFATIVASVAYKAVAFVGGGLAFNSPVYLGPFARADTFALGAALAVLVAAVQGRPLLRGAAPSALRVAAIGVVALAIAARGTGPGYTYFHSLCGLASCLVIGSTTLAARGGGWQRAMASRPLAGLGAISYGIYLLHDPLYQMLAGRVLIHGGAGNVARDAATLVALAILFAAGSYWALERPILCLAGLHPGRSAHAHPAPPSDAPTHRDATRGRLPSS